MEQENKQVPVEEEPLLIPVISQPNFEHNVFQNNIIQEELAHTGTSHTENPLPQHRYPVLQNVLELLRQIRAMKNDASNEHFTSHLSKKQKKQLTKVTTHNIRSKGD